MDKDKMNGRELSDEDLALVHGGITDSNGNVLTCFSTTSDVQIMPVMDCMSCSVHSTCLNRDNTCDGSKKQIGIIKIVVDEGHEKPTAP